MTRKARRVWALSRCYGPDFLFPEIHSQNLSPSSNITQLSVAAARVGATTIRTHSGYFDSRWGVGDCK